MRHLVIFLLLLLVGTTSCTLLMPEKTIVRGSIWLVPQAEIRQAIAVARAGYPPFASAPVDTVIVESRSELSVHFHSPNGNSSYILFYAVVRRVDGRWRYIGATDDVIVD